MTRECLKKWTRGIVRPVPGRYPGIVGRLSGQGLWHQGQPDANLGIAFLTITQQGFSIAFVELDVQVAVHVQECALQGPGGVQLNGMAPMMALLVYARQDRTSTRMNSSH